MVSCNIRHTQSSQVKSGKLQHKVECVRWEQLPRQNEVQQQHHNHTNDHICQPGVEDVHSAMEAWHVGLVLAQDQGVGGDQHEEHSILEGGESILSRHKGEEAGEDHDGVWVAGYWRPQHNQISCNTGALSNRNPFRFGSRRHSTLLEGIGGGSMLSTRMSKGKQAGRKNDSIWLAGYWEAQHDQVCCNTSDNVMLLDTK